MKFWDIIKTANANLLRNKGRTFLTILAVFIGSFVIMLTTGMNAGVNNYIDKQLNAVGGNGYMDVAAGTDLTSSVSSGLGGDIETATKYDPSKDSSQTATISTDQIKKIRALSGVTRVEPFRWSSSSYITGGKTSDKFVMTNPQQSLAWTGMNVDLTAGRMPDENSTQPQITVEAKFVKALGYNSANDILGATVRVGVANSLTKKISEVSGTVVGVFNPSMVFGGRDWTNAAMFDKIFNASMAGMPAVYQNETSALGLTYDKNFTNDQVQNLKDQLTKIGVTGMTPKDEAGMVQSVFSAITVVLTIFGVIALVAASIGIINTLFMAVQERTREIGLMKAMGLGKGKIRLMFSVEAIALGFWGSAVGVGLAFVARAILNRVAVNTFLKNLPGFTLIQLHWSALIVIALIVMAIAFLAGALPARRASKLNPIDALRYE